MNEIVQKIHEIIISPTERRETVNHVNLYKNYLVATDGHMLVYIDASLIADHGVTCECLNNVCDENKNVSLSNPRPEFNITSSEMLEFYNGYKKSDLFEHRKEYIDCEECHGEGFTECCECETELDCKECRGDGRISVKNHNGFYEPKNRSLLIKAAQYNYDALFVYRALSVLLLIHNEPTALNVAVTKGTLRLWCKGFVAVIMGIRVDDDDKSFKVIGTIGEAKN